VRFWDKNLQRCIKLKSRFSPCKASREYMSLSYKGRTVKFQYENYCAGEVQLSLLPVSCMYISYVYWKTWSYNLIKKKKQRKMLVPLIIRCNLITTSTLFCARSRFSLCSLYSLKSIIRSKNMILVETESEPAYIDRFTPRWNAFAISSAAMAT